MEQTMAKTDTVTPEQRWAERFRKMGQTLYIMRRDRRMSQAALAKKAGVSRNYIGQIERGQADLTLKTLSLVLAAMDSVAMIEFRPEKIALNGSGGLIERTAPPQSTELFHHPV